MKNKFVIILSFIFIVLVDSGLQGQSILNKRINFRVKNLSISEALSKLSEDNDINIAFSSAFFDSNKKLTVNKSNSTVKHILKIILKNTNIEFKENNGSILLLKSDKTSYNIFGYIRDIESGEVLPGATIFDLKSGSGVVSNGYGYYCIELPKGDDIVVFSYLGYKTVKQKINLNTDKNLNIKMTPFNYLKDVVIVSPKRGRHMQESTNQNIILSKKLSTFSVAGGEPDLLRQLSTLPGVQSGADGFGGLHIRGGNADQNLILLDDVPIFNPSHSIGLFSIFNTSVVKNAILTKGGFPSRYGGRLSSVLEVRTKDGNMLKPSASIGLSFIASSITVETPIIKNKMSILLSARRSHLDNYLKKISRKTKEDLGKIGQTDYHFLDLNAKLNFKLSNRDRLYLSFYSGSDSFEDITHGKGQTKNDPRERRDSLNYSYDWGNKVMSFRWNHLFNKKLFSNTSLIYSNFEYNSKLIDKNSYYYDMKKVDEFIKKSTFNSAVEELSIRTDFDYFLNKKHRLKSGLGATRRKLTPTILNKLEIYNYIDSSVVFKNPIAVNDINYTGYDLYGYLSDQFDIGNFECNIGLHFSSFILNKNLKYSIQPRITTKYHFNKNITISASIAKMTQYLHLLSTTDSGLPSDLWVPSTTKAKPENSWISTFGFQYKITNGWILNTEIYSKKMDGMQYYIDSVFNLVPNQDINVSSWEEIINPADGKSIGLEFLVEKYKGKLTGWISYTISKSSRFILGKEIPYKYNSLNSFHTQLSYALTKSINFNLGWSYQSGLPADQHKQSRTSFLFSDLFNSSDLDIKNNKLPAYHKLDLGVSINIIYKRFLHSISFGAYNVYNRKNALFIFKKDNVSKEWVKINSLPIMPSLRYVLTFR